jgi:chromosomal replication initiation ATPase DnaA
LPSQLPLPFEPRSLLRREDFIVASSNAAAVAFVDAFRPGPMQAAALYGPAGAGKTHLAHAWATVAGARVIEAAALTRDLVADLDPATFLAVENVDAAPSPDEVALFALFQQQRLVLFTGVRHPRAWHAASPDLISRFRALPAYELGAPDEALLADLARKLFTDRQLTVPEAVIARILRSIERSPAAVRDFVARADAYALAAKRPVTVQLVGDLLDR